METGLVKQSISLKPTKVPERSEGNERGSHDPKFTSARTDFSPLPGFANFQTANPRHISSTPRGQTGPERGDRRAEYLLVIYPYGDLRDRLLEEQQQFSSDYEVMVRDPMRRIFGPHITVAAFQAAEGMEDTLIRWIQRICHRYERFDLTLNNYSGIPPHTICLRVQDPQPFRRLMQQLRAIDDYIRSSGCPPVNLIDRPYLSIAGGLTEQVYNRAMPEYSRKTFHESFPVDELVLLKRDHHFDPCRTVNIFRLLPASTDGSPAGTLPHL